MNEPIYTPITEETTPNAQRPTPNAQLAADEAGYHGRIGFTAFCEGYDAATAELSRELGRLSEENNFLVKLYAKRLPKLSPDVKKMRGANSSNGPHTISHSEPPLPIAFAPVPPQPKKAVNE